MAETPQHANAPHAPGRSEKKPDSHHEVAQLKSEVERAKEQYLRTLAEVENTKKRLQREKEEFAKFAAEGLVRDLLPIVDSLDQAVVAVDKQADLPAPQSEAARQAGAPAPPARLQPGPGRTAIALDGPGQALVKGIHLIHRQLLGLLKKEGVSRIPTVGEPFDPHVHEAVAQVEAKDGAADGTVVEEVHVGYTLHGKVIRPAMVKVAKTKEQKSEHADGGGPHNG